MDHPILFNTEMVKAALSGQKTMTRQVINRLKGFGKITEFQKSTTRGYDWAFRDKRMLWNDIGHNRLMECCPLGQPGDILWVRETFARVLYGYETETIYRADEQNLALLGDAFSGWKPSTFMPRTCCRLKLKIKSINLEPIQDISNTDILSEGTYFDKSTPGIHPDPFEDFEQGFINLWDSINKKRGYGWDTNPWVWVIEFKKKEEA